MTATLEAVANRKKDKPEPTAEQKLAGELVARSASWDVETLRSSACVGSVLSLCSHG